MGKTSRVKGASYERRIAALFRDMGWEDAKRHLEYQEDEAEMGRDLDGTEPFAIQAKCWKSTPSIMALNQVIPDDDYPIRVAVLKRTQSKGVGGIEVAVLDLEVFLRMVSVIERLAEEAYHAQVQHTVLAKDPWDYIADGN